MDWPKYFSNLQVDYIPPTVSESKLLEAFWLSLTSIPETKIEIKSEYFPGTTKWACFPRKDFKFDSRYTPSKTWDKNAEYLIVKFSKRAGYTSIDCNFGTSFWWRVERSISSFTVQGNAVDREIWLNEFADLFKKVRFG